MSRRIAGVDKNVGRAEQLEEMSRNHFSLSRVSTFILSYVSRRPAAVIRMLAELGNRKLLRTLCTGADNSL